MSHKKLHRFQLFCKDHPQFLIMVGVFVFYSPFMPNYFMGDDWLWLANADRALADPVLLLQRPIYGYFRPIYMLYIGLCHRLFDLNALAFGYTNLLFHLLNCHLLFKVALRFNLGRQVALMSTIFFGFYFLNCSALCWISSGSDILVVTLLLTFSWLLVGYFSSGSGRLLLLLLLAGIAAVLIKEVGVMSLALFFLYPLIAGINPLRGKFLAGSVTFVLLFAAYLVFYFVTRTTVDKELIITSKTVINLWFLFVYLFLPFSKRIVAALGDTMQLLIQWVKAIFTVIAPLGWAWLFLKRATGERYFLLWPLVLLLPVSLFDWSVGLFSLYPERTASRFMYTAIPGMAVIVAMIVSTLFEHILRLRTIRAVLLATFVGASFLAVAKVTGLYRSHQATSQFIFDSLVRHRDSMNDCDSVVIVSGDETMNSRVFSYTQVLESMAYIATGTEIGFSLASADEVLPDSLPGEEHCILRWESDTHRLEPSNP